MFQDIRRPKKSLREILPAKEAPALEPESVDYESAPQLYGRRRWPRGLGLVLIALLVLGGGFWISERWASVVIDLTPKQGTLILEAVSIKLPYEIASFDPIKAARPVTATETRKVERKASGTIIVYNNYSKNPERLVANTRFEAASGKIYRINEAITVPGGGSLEVLVYADQPGEAYNAPLTTFTIPGFKGDPRYDKFTAKSKTPMTGGFVGNERVIDEKTKLALEADLKREITERALEQARFQIPKDYVLFAEGLTLDWASSVVGASTVASSSLILEGTPKALILKRDTLVSEILKAEEQTAVVGKLNINNIDKLQLEFINLAHLFTLTDDTAKREAELVVSGNADTSFVVDTESLVAKLAGSKKRDAEIVFQQFPAIAAAKVNFRPPWIREFPTDPAKIQINVVD